MMKKVSKIKLLSIILCCAVWGISGINNAWAGNYNCKINNLGINVDLSDRAKITGTEADDLKAAKEAYNAAEAKMVAYCNKANDAFEWSKDYWVYITADEIYAKMKSLKIYDKFLAAKKELEAAIAKLRTFKPSENACGEKFPDGCPVNQSCFKCETRMGGNEHDQMTFTEYKCAEEKPGGLTTQCIKIENSGGHGSQIVQQAGVVSAVVDTNTSGETVTGHIGLGAKAKSIDELWNDKDKWDDGDPRSNAGYCNIAQLKKDYMGTCYSCTIVATLIRTFMKAAAYTEGLTQEAGVRLLAIGMMIWLAFFVLGKLSSFVSQEPMQILQELFRFFFKCAIAYTLITAGLQTMVAMIVNPILGAGADYGIGIIDAVAPESVKIDGYATTDNNSYKLVASKILDDKVFTKIMDISKKADGAVSLNFVIGDALMCHSIHAGAYQFAKSLTEKIGFEFFIPDIWLWLCGLLIWVFAFMVTLAVNFYLLDLSFKIGFALIAMPVTLGLWPFNKFKGQFESCIKIIANAAGTFLFLGITTGVSLVLISAGIGGTAELFKAIETDNKYYVAAQFSLTGAKFLLVLFVFVYSHKMISTTVSKLADKFFSSNMSGMSPMHHKATQMIDMAKQGVTTVASGVGGAVGGVVGKAASNVATKATRGVVQGISNGAKAVGKAGKKMFGGGGDN